MENNKTLILKESELIDFLSYIVTDVIKEQDIEWPDPTSKVSVSTQIGNLGKTNSTSSPQAFVDYWFNKCNHPVYGPVKALYNNTNQAIKCHDSMPQSVRTYKNGSNRQYIAALWKEKVDEILLRIDTELIPKMSSVTDMSNLTADDAILYEKYEEWISQRFYAINPELRPSTINWKLIEYVADAIGIIALFFGPVGWIVSGVAGLVSAYAMYEQGNTGGAYVVGALELIPGLKLIKHFKHLKQFKRMKPEQISKGLTYFEEPTELVYKSLNKVEKELVDYTIKNPSIIKPLLKVTDEAIKAKDVIKNIKNMKQFWKFAKTPAGIKHGLDKIGWKEFQQIQKALTTSEKIITNVKNGIKIAAPFVIGAIPAVYAISWAMYGANKLVFQNIISETDDLITGKKLDNTYHYIYDRVLNQTYPYNKSFTKGDDYTGIFENALAGMPPNILLLVKLWRDATMFPEITPVKDSCVGVELGEIANPGGGWRPNLDCLTEYNLNRVTGKIETMSTEIATSIDELAIQLQEETITIEGAQKIVGDALNLEVEEYVKLEFPSYETVQDSIEAGDYEVW